MMKFISVPALAIAGALPFGSVEAATLNIAAVTGEWSSVQTTGTTTNLSGLGSSAISWGTASGAAGQSGYTFTGLAPSGSLVPEAVYDIGKFTHQNQPISSGTSVLGATLTVIVDLLIDGASAKLVSQFDFSHFETLNQAVRCADGERNGSGVNSAGCADHVSAMTNLGMSDSFFTNGVQYILEVTGFMKDGRPFTEFWTTEGQPNSSILQARFTAKPLPSPIPLPATVWLMIAALGGLAAFRVRRRKA